MLMNLLKKPPHPVACGARPLPQGERAKSGGCEAVFLQRARHALAPGGRGLPPQGGWVRGLSAGMFAGMGVKSWA